MTQVVVLKKKTLMLKHEGKLAKAKGELKGAKFLEQQLEGGELLAEAEDSEDELSALIHGMDNDKEEFLDLHDHSHGFYFDNLLGMSDDLDANFEVTDKVMMNPELADALESLGWIEPKNTFSKFQPFKREALLNEIQSLKKEALNKKRRGNVEEAMAILKKEKLLESDFNSSGAEENNNMIQKSTTARKSVSSKIAGNGLDSIQMDERNTNATNNAASLLAPKNQLMIQRELLSLKMKVLSLRREGKLNEAEEELCKGAALENQLMEMSKASNLKTSQMNTRDNVPHAPHKHPDIYGHLALGEGGEDDVTDQGMSNPAYLSLLRDLGWNDNNNEISNSPSKPFKKDGNHFVPINGASLSQHSTNILAGAPRRSKFDIQRELLGLKRKSLALRREGKTEDAEEVLKMTKELEARMVEMQAPKIEIQVEVTMMKDKILNPPVEEGRDGIVSEEDTHDPALNSMLIDLGWKDEKPEPMTTKEEPVKEATSRFTHTVDLSVVDSSSDIAAVAASRSQGEIQRELLLLKRKALAVRCKGEVEEAEEILRTAKSLEAQMEDFGTQNKEFLLNVSKDQKLVLSESFNFHERHGGQIVALELDKGSASSVVGSSKYITESSIILERISNEKNNPLRKVDNLIRATSQLADNKYPLSVEVSASSEIPAKRMKAAETICHSSSVGHSMNMLDLLTGDGCGGSEISTQKQKEEHKAWFSKIISSRSSSFFGLLSDS